MPQNARGQLIRLGLFTIMGIAAFAMLVFLFRPIARTIRGGYKIRVHLDYAGEMQTGTPVRYLGINAGEVLSVDYAPPERGGVIVTVLMNRDAAVHNDPDARPYVDTKLVTGEASLEFPRANPQTPLLKAGDEIEGLYRPTAPDIVAQMGRLSLTADATLREIQSAAGLVRDEVRRIGASTVQVTDGAARLVEFHPVEDPSLPLPPSQRNISTAVQRLDVALANLNQVLTEKGFLEDVRATVANLKTTSERLAEAADLAKATFTDLRAVADRGETLALKFERTIDKAGIVLDDQNANLTRVGHSVIATAERLSAFLTTAQGLVADAGEGKGSVGRLLSDPALFEELIKAVAQARQALSEIHILASELTEHPGDYISLGKRATSEDERKTRIEKERRDLKEPNP